MGKIIRIYYEFEGRIEKSVPMITVCHHEVCRVMTNGDPRDRFFYPTLIRTIDFFLAQNCFYLFILKKFQNDPEYAKTQLHLMTLLDALNKIAWVR